MDEATAVEIAWKAVNCHLDQLDGFESARKISPRHLYDEWIGKGLPEAGIPVSFKTRKDFWAVLFRLKIPANEMWCPAHMIVDVDDETGESQIVPGL